MAEREFTVEFRGITFAVVVDYHEGDKAMWHLVSAKPEDDDADFLGFLQADNHTSAEFDRGCDLNMREWAGTGADDAMDVVHAKIDKGVLW